MCITTRGRVTIPKDIRDQSGLLPNTVVEFVLLENDVVVLNKQEPFEAKRGATTMTTDELLALRQGDRWERNR